MAHPYPRPSASAPAADGAGAGTTSASTAVDGWMTSPSQEVVFFDPAYFRAVGSQGGSSLEALVPRLTRTWRRGTGWAVRVDVVWVPLPDVVSVPFP